MAALTADLLSQLSTLLYGAAYDESQWTLACESLRQAFNSQAASLLVRQDARFDRVHGDCDRYYSDLYWNELMRYDPLQAGPAGDPQCSLYTDQSVLSKTDFRKSIMYNEWFAPQEMHGVLLLKVFDEHGANTIFTLNRSIGQPDFDAHDLEAMKVLEPVLRHVIQIRQHQALLRLEARSSAFEQMRVAHIIVNRQRQVLHMNATADRLFAMASMPIFMAQKRLDISNRQDANALDGLISRACTDPGLTQDPVGEMLLRAERGPSLALSVFPLVDAVGYGLNARYAASIVIRVLGAGGAPRIEAQLQRLFGLSGKEAELAAALLNGCSLQDAAEERNVSLTTVRSQLASLFRKTGTVRQGQLIALLAQLGSSI